MKKRYIEKKHEIIYRKKTYMEIKYTQRDNIYGEKIHINKKSFTKKKYI